MNRIAEDYVKLVLAVGVHDRDYVDAYYGPPEWRTEVAAAPPSLVDIRARAAVLLTELAALRPDGDELSQLRHGYLIGQLKSLVARVDMLSGKRLSFDEESKALYDAVAPTYPDAHFDALLAELEPLLPGEGPVAERYERYREGFVVPPRKIDAVFRAAIDECRARTLQHFPLPEGESFAVEYVTGKSWNAYNWYEGAFHSRIEVNTELPIHIDQAIDLACHEGYPGHHVYNALLEQRLLRGRGWVEYSVYPLFSPQSLIAEGTANFGIDVAFPGPSRVAFERERLFPLAGLDPANAERYYAVHKNVARLSYAGNEAARLYLDGRIDREEAVERLMRYSLNTRARAERRVRFFDQYRSYVINYNLGQDLVRRYIELRGGTESDEARRWEEFENLLSSPRLPSGLAVPQG